MNKLKLKTNEKGYCDEVLLNSKKIGEGISKIEVVIEAGEKAKLILTFPSNSIDIECEDVEIKKQVNS